MAEKTECTDLWNILLVLESSNVLKGKRISVTGHLGVKRTEFIQVIEMAGGEFVEQPRYGTHFLVTNKSWNEGSTVEAKASSKLLKAQREGIKIISEKKFCELILAGQKAMEDQA